MNKIRIFLASSEELENDRRALEIEIRRKNQQLHDKGIYLELNIWEDFFDAISATRLQDEYNKVIQDCDLFFMLYFTKVGKYTMEEFEIAYQHFKENDSPDMLVYFKNAEVEIGSLNKQGMNSLWDFQDRLQEIGHFYSSYSSTDKLLLEFNKQIDKYLNTIQTEIEDTNAVGVIGDVVNSFLDQDRLNNEQLIRGLIQNHHLESKSDIVQLSGFKKGKVNRVLSRLLSKNQIRITENGWGIV